ncbi:MAG: hypothetical protein EOP88_05370 [Verrucomicrobiaceae bacterium]|nr:MAG: hypothetical protein EOP88_05370 [Verrucomicrobiaceae bacterium]
MSTLLDSLNRQSVSASAHPLFPRSQAFLWLPGFSGHAAPFCSYNCRWDDDTGEPVAGACDTLLQPPYPVSQESFIAWNTSVVPPFPYHPVPVVRALSAEEIREIGAKVAEISMEAAGDGVHAVRNENKHLILTLLAQAGLLASRTEDLSRVA